MASKPLNMKKFSIFLMALAVGGTVFGQSDRKKLPSLGVSIILNDFEGAREIREMGLSKTLDAGRLDDVKRMAPGLAISYHHGITNNIDFVGELSGSFVNYSSKAQAKGSGDAFLLEAAGLANVKLLNDRYILNPYLTAGIGGMKYRSSFGAFVPLGLGLQVKLGPEVFLQLQSQYRIPVTDKPGYHLYHGLGIVAPLKSRAPEPVAVETPMVVLDRDGDGVLDADDLCPDTPGLANLQGCPDRDGDGIADGQDKCPDQAGLAKYEGCPIPDTDGDGINDEEDKCPTEKGVARYQGCPVPDTDGDGVNDEEDKCPTRPGPASNQGCPEISKEVVEKINIAAKNVFFATGKYTLLAKSNASLNEVARLMKDDPSLILDIAGHTDDVGSEESNQVLSENRANAVKQYLIKQGIAEDRLNSQGYGETKPVADNKTAAGRAKNRRTEMTARNY